MVEIKTITHPAVNKPELPEFRELAAGSANLIPVIRTFPVDLESPVTVYLKLIGTTSSSFLLESVEGGEQVGRYSFVGVDPRGSVSLRGRGARLRREGRIGHSKE